MRACLVAHLLMCITPYNDSGSFFFFNDTATTEIYTLSLHDALPIYVVPGTVKNPGATVALPGAFACAPRNCLCRERSEEHTSELQSHSDIVCRLLLEKKTNTYLIIREVMTVEYGKCHAGYCCIHSAF